MAFLTQVDTETTANTNLTPNPVLVDTFTNTTRIRKLWVNVFVDQCKGNGDYTAYITIQRAGAGVWYESVKTTKAVAAGITSIVFNSISITLNSTDVMKVYLLGLATDNDGTADVIVDVNEEWVNIDASGRVDVGAWVGTVMVATLFDGITVLANWLRLLVRKDAAIAADAAAQLAEMNQNMGTGIGTFASTTDSEEAIRDRGDAAWVTGAALTAQDVRDAMKLTPTAGVQPATSIDGKINALVPGAPINLNAPTTIIHSS